jgi:hypothetical protein
VEAAVTVVVVMVVVAVPAVALQRALALASAPVLVLVTELVDVILVEARRELQVKGVAAVVVAATAVVTAVVEAAVTLTPAAESTVHDAFMQFLFALSLAPVVSAHIRCHERRRSRRYPRLMRPCVRRDHYLRPDVSPTRCTVCGAVSSSAVSACLLLLVVAASCLLSTQATAPLTPMDLISPTAPFTPIDPISPTTVSTLAMGITRSMPMVHVTLSPV